MAERAADFQARSDDELDWLVSIAASLHGWEDQKDAVKSAGSAQHPELSQVDDHVIRSLLFVRVRPANTGLGYQVPPAIREDIHRLGLEIVDVSMIWEVADDPLTMGERKAKEPLLTLWLDLAATNVRLELQG